MSIGYWVQLSIIVKWAATWQNQQNGLWLQRRLRSAWASAQSDQSSLSTWRWLGSLATHWAHSEDSDQTGRMPRLIWVFAGSTVTLLVLSCRGSNGVLIFVVCRLSVSLWLFVRFIEDSLVAICWERAVLLAVFTLSVLGVCFPIPFDVWDRMWNSTVLVPDHCLFIYFTYTWAGPWENVSYVICEQQRRRSACAFAQSDQCLCFLLLR